MTTTAEELLYDLAESVRPGARGFHGMCPEMAAKIIAEALEPTLAMATEIEDLRAYTAALEDSDNWTAEVTVDSVYYTGPEMSKAVEHRDREVREAAARAAKRVIPKANS